MRIGPLSIIWGTSPYEVAVREIDDVLMRYLEAKRKEEMPEFWGDIAVRAMDEIEWALAVLDAKEVR